MLHVNTFTVFDGHSGCYVQQAHQTALSIRHGDAHQRWQDSYVTTCPEQIFVQGVAALLAVCQRC